MHNSIDNNWPKTAFQILEAAANIIAEKFVDSDAYCNPSDTKDFLRFKMGKYEREVFALMLLDGQHRLIEFQELFFGSINSATVHPREVVKAVLNANAAAVILAHNHPSGVPEPSQADISLTKRIKESLQLIDVPVLDHIVVGKDCVSLAERGLV